MKKRMIPVLIVFLALAAAAQDPAQFRLKNSIGIINLTAPADESTFSKVPLNIKFSWTQPLGVASYTLEIQVLSGQNWNAFLTRTNLKTNAVTVTCDQRADMRWRVLGLGNRGARFMSPWWEIRYRGSGAAAGAQAGTAAGGTDLTGTAAGGTDLSGTHVVKKPTPQFHPVPISPKHEAVLRNYPRNMTFTWLHSTNPAYHHYQIQVDVYHPNPRRWQSQMRGQTLLVDAIVNDNRFDYTFPADRIGRWRVRGVKNKRQVTPWSVWRTFSFRARH